MKENRLVYMAGEGTPGAPSGEGSALVAELGQMGQKLDAGMAALTEAMPGLAAVKERGDFQKALEQTPADKEKLFAEIAKGLDKPFAIQEQDVNFEKLKGDVKTKATAAVLKFEDELWDAITVDGAMDRLKRAEFVSQVFTHEVVRQIEVAKTAGTLATKKSFEIKYADQKINVVLSDQDVATETSTDPAKPLSPQEQLGAKLKEESDAAAKEIMDNPSLMAFFSIFGEKDPVTGQPDLSKAAGNPVIQFIGWLFGAKFGEKFMGPIVKAVSARRPDWGEKATGLKKIFQDFIGPTVSSEQPTVKENFLGGLDPKWATIGIDKAVTLKNAEMVRPGKELIIDIPEGKTVDLKGEDLITLRYVENGDLYSSQGNKITAPKGGLKLKLAAGQTIPQGAVFGEGVKVSLKDVDEDGVVAEAKAPEAPAAEAVTEADKAKAEEAPTETPAV